MNDDYENAIESLVKGSPEDLNTISEETGKTALWVYRKYIKGKALTAYPLPLTIFSHGNDAFVFKFEVATYCTIPNRVVYLSCMDTRVSFLIFHANERVFSCAFDITSSWYNIQTLLMLLVNEQPEKSED